MKCSHTLFTFQVAFSFQLLEPEAAAAEPLFALQLTSEGFWPQLPEGQKYRMIIILKGVTPI